MLILPKQMVFGRLNSFLDDLSDLCGSGSPGPVALDFSRLSFVDAAGAVTLANAVDYLRSLGFSPLPRLPLPGTPAITYLRDWRFFKFLEDPHATDLTPGRNSIFPLSRVSHTNTFDLLKNRFTPWLGNRLSISTGSLEQLRVCLGELFNNIEDHSGVSTGFFFAQHVPDFHRVRIALADFGVGIPAKVRSKLPKLDDGAALAKAFEEGFSTKSTPRNRGAGLDWLKRYAIETNGGSVSVASHFGRLRAKPHAGNVKFVPTVGRVFFPGVLHYISLRTDTIEAVEETRGELEW